MMALGGGFTGWSWHTALTEDTYYRKVVFLFPCFLVIGLGALLFPIDVERLRAEYGVEKIERFRQLPLVWKVLTFVAPFAGLANWWAIAHI
jgi:hypothetical protein